MRYEIEVYIKMRIFFNALAIILVVSIFPQQLHAQEKLVVKPLNVGRPCRAADVIGLWESTDVYAAQPSAARHYSRVPHDYLRFSSDGGFMYFGTSQPMSNVTEINATLDGMDRTDGVTYKAAVRPNGALLILRDGRFFQGFTCTISTDGLPKGAEAAMIWTELDGFPTLKRVQVRIR